jgi:tetratricopeptide (TPR) repeat protein
VTSVTHAQEAPARPFPGIESFGYRDQSIFFGREGDSRRLIQLVVVYRGVLLFGESGSGKSSLINAGLIPRAMEEGLLPERLRVQPRRDEELIVERIERRSGEYLPSILVEEAKQASVVISCDELERRIREQSTDWHPLLVFDQFEELLTLFDGPKGMETQRVILQILRTLLMDPMLRVKVVLSFREDYLAKLRSLLRVVPNLGDHAMHLQSLHADRETLFELIRGPFEAHPKAFKRTFDVRLTAELADALNERFRGGQVNLSELQIVCRRLWVADEPRDELAEKGIERIVADYYSGALERLDARLQGPAVAVLARLVTSAGTRNIVTEQDLIAQVLKEQFARDDVGQAIDALEHQARLIARERRHDVVFFELVSEVLVPWIHEEVERRRSAAYVRSPLFVGARHWEELEYSSDALFRGTALEKADALARANPGAIGNLERRFLEESRAYEKRELMRQERRSAWLRRLSIALAVVAPFALAAAVFALIQWRSAADARDGEKAERLDALTSLSREHEARKRERDLRAVAQRELAEIQRKIERGEFVAAQNAVATASERIGGRFLGTSCGSIIDASNAREWFVGPDLDMTWDSAARWVGNLKRCGGAWSMPSASQLRHLYDLRFSAGTGYVKAGRRFPARIHPIFSGIGGGSWVWTSGEISRSTAIAVNLHENVTVQFEKEQRTFPVRAFAVRKPRVSPHDAARLNDLAFMMMKRGRYRQALPLLRTALPALRGVKPNEAYANYNVGKTLLELDRCDEALRYLQRSEQLQGEDPLITTAKRAAAAC